MRIQGDNNTVSWKMSHLKPEIGSRSDRARCVFSARRSGTGIPGLGTSGTTTRAAPGKAPFRKPVYDVGMDQNLSVSTFGGMIIHNHESQLFGGVYLGIT